MSTIEPGTLVTSARAPDGAPDWVGVVVATNAGAFGDVVLRGLGFATEWARAPVTVRPLSDAEAVGLAEMLVDGTWREQRIAGESIYAWQAREWVASHSEVVADLVDSDGEWHARADELRWEVAVNGEVIEGLMHPPRGSLRESVVAASRALVAYTCGWRGKA